MPSVHERALSPVALSGSTAMNRSPRAFLSAVREEILAPVNAIITLSDALLAETRDLENDQADFVNDLGRIHSAGKHLLEMINEHLDPDIVDKDDAESSLAVVQKRVRHDMRNALNPVINYTEMWLEEAAEVFLEGFAEDLRRIHGLGKTCLGLLDKVAAYQQGQLPDEGAGPTQATISLDPLFKWQTALDARAASEPGYCLVVDDNATNRDILCRLLVRQGHRVATAVNGREALAMAAAEAFDIVLLDIIMPEMNGFEVLHHLKADDRLRAVPVIMISALDQDDAVLRCIAMGAEDYLPRPFNPLLL